MNPLIATWLAIGNKNLWVQEACDPPFTERSFHECKSDEDLLDKFWHGNWCLGQAFYVGDLCFINQIDGGSEWLTIKGDLAFESISFRYIIQRDGRAAAQAYLDKIRRATPAQCKALTYMEA